MIVAILPDKTAKYFPFSKGRYEVTPGLYQFGSKFGNGEADKRVFQIDPEFAHYRANKLRARRERLSKYYCVNRYSILENRVIAGFICRRLTKEYPQQFNLVENANGMSLHCILSNETLLFDSDMMLLKTEGAATVTPSYVSALDAIACQIPEDFAIISKGSNNSHWLSALHLCSPNGWSAEQKIGKSFATIHTPVAGMDNSNQAQDQIVNAMINNGPYTRFAWGLVRDQKLNHHPASAVKSVLGQPGTFSPDEPGLFLRIERQCIWGFPEAGAALFTIRTYFQDCHELRRDEMQREQLIAAIQSMSEEQLAYKGLRGNVEQILRWLSE